MRRKSIYINNCLSKHSNKHIKTNNLIQFSYVSKSCEIRLFRNFHTYLNSKTKGEKLDGTQSFIFLLAQNCRNAPKNEKKPTIE